MEGSQRICRLKDADNQYPVDFRRQQGGNWKNLQELTQVSDWNDGTKPTHLPFERCG
ncbi:hypothetical protein [Rouxiella sp. WC2420]|uniref:Uncharacterized protein n=1 Tax=Rouxiella sp. WC2420 TaxID=3234145 RepID=A0AB39VUY5_9GAMM